jgi:nitrogen fixation/metabolism regulation signal transduction histidine kinase
VRALIFLCVVAGAALVYLMSEASANTTFFTQNYRLLIGLGGGLSLGLMALIGYQLMLLRRKLRERVFGSKLTLRLMVVFALMALIPGGMVYAISFQFLQRSIESWFDVRVDESLKVGLNLAQGAMQNSLKELGEKAETMANALATSQATEAASLNRLREQHLDRGSHPLHVARRVIAQSSSDPVALAARHPGLEPPAPGAHAAARARHRGHPERGLFLRVIVPGERAHIADDIRALPGAAARAPARSRRTRKLIESG